MAGRHEKLRKRLLSEPKDFRWNELLRLAGWLNYRQAKGGRTSGSRVRFVHDEFEDLKVHRPHPGNIIKLPALRDIIRQLKARGQI